MPPGDHPFVEQLLQLRDCEAQRGVHVGAAACDVRAEVAGHVLAEQRIDASESSFDQCLVGWGAGVRGLDRDAQ